MPSCLIISGLKDNGSCGMSQHPFQNERRYQIAEGHSLTDISNIMLERLSGYL